MCGRGCHTLAGGGTPQGSAKAATCRQHGDDLGRLARRCRGDARMGCHALADGDAAWSCKGGDPPSAWRRSRSVRTPPPREGSCLRQRRASSAPCCPRGKPAALGQSRAGGAPLREGAPRFRRFRFTCGSGAYFRNVQAPEGAPAAPLSLRKRCLLRSATDSGSRLFVRPPCGSGVCCAARRTAGYGSSSVLPAKAAFTARPAPAPRRRPPRWRAWPEGSCPSAHPASSRASPRPSR